MSKKPALTPWFPPDVKPARHGVYQTRLVPLPFDCYRHWNGSEWGCGSGVATVAAAMGARQFMPSATQNWCWRGLAEQPK